MGTTNKKRKIGPRKVEGWKKGFYLPEVEKWNE